MQISQETVQSIAELARLELSDEEIALYADQLSSILDYFDHIQQVDTTQVESLATVLPIQNVMREDVKGVGLPPEDVVANAPDAEANQFRVSAVLDE